MSSIATRRTGLILVAVVAAVALGGCRTADGHWGRMSMRGAAYKRLIPTYAETLGMTEDIQLRFEAEAMAGASDDRLWEITDLREEVQDFSLEIHRALELRRRIKWHRTRMDSLWNQYNRLFRDRGLRRAYKSERTVDRDEIRMRRTPLTGEMRFSVLDYPSWDMPPEEMGIFDVNGNPAIDPESKRSREPSQWNDVRRRATPGS